MNTFLSDAPSDLPASCATNPPQTMMMTESGGPVRAEIIPGYTIEQSIGSGGFGEVFAAVAPGGIRKAIKIVYGTLDESRAERELKSLERVKQVRHPFVISIDRIELADNQLVIVTELADESLRQRFDECRRDSRPGIPRDELLKYLADAADALDYLYADHSLQHLDVKPENLLLLSGHIKVADFGLLKDLRDTQMSMMGGVTPLYAPPEVLDGQPDFRSDQYALAIVYQEMLTGQLPFNGRTPGQLAAQHLHSAPNLTPLPSTDRYAIGRALSKSPARRFATCREMIDALIHPPKQALAKAPSVQSTIGGGSLGESTAAVASEQNSPLLQPQERTCQVAPPQTLPSGQPARPTIVIGLGGIGCEAVRRFRRDAARQFQSSGLPSIQLLAIDIDPKMTKGLRQGFEADDSDSLDAHEILHTPLRPSSGYRDDKSVYLPWLSRRWLYNVPRSLLTEGMRPLGRLAVVDNAASVRRRVGELLDDACKPDAAAQSAAASGQPFADVEPQVFLVGTSTGGTSSGAMTDLAYGVSELLRERGLKSRPHAVLMHALPVQDDKRDLATANAAALFGELMHFDQSAEGWPGDGAVWSATHDSPLASVSLIDCPEQWDNADSPTHPTETAAAYLMQNVLGTSAAFYDHARAADQSASLTVRNVGLVRMGAGRRATASEADSLVRQVLGRWIDSCRGGATGAALMTDAAVHDADPAELLTELGITASIAGADAELVDTAIAGCGQLIEHVHRGAAHAAPEQVAKVIYKAVGVSDQSIEPAQEFRAAARQRMEDDRPRRITRLRRSLFAQNGDDAYTIDDVRRRLYALAAALTDVLQSAQQAAQSTRTHCNGLDEQMRSGPITAGLLEKLVRCRLEAQFACLVADEIQTLIARLLDTGRLFDAAVAPIREAIRMLPPPDPAFARPLEPRQLDPIEQRVAAQVAQVVGPYWFMRLADDGQAAAVLTAAREAAHIFLRERSLHEQHQVDPIDAATPPLAAVAGSLHWLASGPTERSAHAFDDRLAERFGHRPSSAVTRGSDIVLCCEAGDVPIQTVTAAILAGRADLVAVAARLKSRGDVDWSW